MMTPAIRKRIPHIRAGGMCSTAMSIPRYVDPQKKYTSAKARITAKRCWRWVGVMVVEDGKREPRTYQTGRTAGWIRDLSPGGNQISSGVKNCVAKIRFRCRRPNSITAPKNEAAIRQDMVRPRMSTE